MSRARKNALLCSALSLLAACGVLVDNEARFERAKQAFANGDVAAAIVDLKTVLQQSPDHIDARLMLSEARVSTGDLVGAANDLELAVRHLSVAPERANADRELIQARAKLAALLLTLRNFAPALENARLILEADPTSIAAYAVASQAAYSLGDNATSRSYAVQLLERSPDNLFAEAILGFIDVREGAHAEAEARFSAALARQPNHYAVRLALTQLQIIKKQPGSAVGTLAPLLVAAPTDARLLQLIDLMQLGGPEARARVEEIAQSIEQKNEASPVPSLLRGRSLQLAGEYEAAAGQFHSAVAKGGGRYPTIGYYVTQRAAGNHAAAQPALERWVEANPDDQAAGFLLATAFVEQGQNDRARELYERLVGAADVDSPLILNNLAWLYGEINDPRGIEAARQAHQLAPDNGAITDTLGWLLIKAGQHQEGIRLLKLAVQQSPESDDVRYHLAIALSEVDEQDEAQRQIERVLRGRAESGADFAAGDAPP
jgi:tetratricopeptide (TPR) repeat protein